MHKARQAAFLAVLITLTVLSACSAAAPNARQEEANMQNAVNFGKIAWDGESAIYYIEAAEDGYRLVHKTAEKSTVITEDTAAAGMLLTAHGLYYMNRDWNICTLAADGSTQLVVAEDCSNYVLCGEWLYYTVYLDAPETPSIDRRLFRAHADGSKPTELAVGQMRTLWAYNGAVWYAEKQDLTTSLYRIDGEGNCILYDQFTEGASDFFILEDMLYYHRNNELLRRPLSDLQAEPTLLSERRTVWKETINIYNDYILYASPKEYEDAPGYVAPITIFAYNIHSGETKGLWDAKNTQYLYVANDKAYGLTSGFSHEHVLNSWALRLH